MAQTKRCTRTAIINAIVMIATILGSQGARAKLLGPIKNGGSIRVGYAGIGPNILFGGPYLQWSLASTGDKHIRIMYCTGRIRGSFSIHQTPQYLTLERDQSGCMNDTFERVRTDAITPDDVTQFRELMATHGVMPSENIARSSLKYAVTFPVSPVPVILPTTAFDSQWPITATIYATINGKFDPAPTAPGSVVSVSYDINEGSLNKPTDKVYTWIEMKVDRIELDDYQWRGD
ncbi:hypothetical protein IRX65_003548 [Salmonella enterica]|nr:hypothetical protein [Salmonella enterica]